MYQSTFNVEQNKRMI